MGTFRFKSDLRHHQAIVQARLYDCLMVTQITLFRGPGRSAQRSSSRSSARCLASPVGPQAAVRRPSRSLVYLSGLRLMPGPPLSRSGLLNERTCRGTASLGTWPGRSAASLTVEYPPSRASFDSQRTRASRDATRTRPGPLRSPASDSGTQQVPTGRTSLAASRCRGSGVVDRGSEFPGVHYSKLIRSIGVAGYPRDRGLEPIEDGSDAYFLTSGGARARFSGSERCKDVQVSLCGEHGYIHSACRQQRDHAPEFYSTSTCTAAGWDRAQGTSLTH